jgi:hypothetical protein
MNKLQEQKEFCIRYGLTMPSYSDDADINHLYEAADPNDLEEVGADDLVKAWTYCCERHVLAFFDHPSLRKEQGRISIVDQDHLVISRAEAQPVEWRNRYFLTPINYTVTLQTHMDKLCRKLKLSRPAQAKYLFDWLCAKARDLAKDCAWTMTNV